MAIAEPKWLNDRQDRLPDGSGYYAPNVEITTPFLTGANLPTMREQLRGPEGLTPIPNPNTTGLNYIRLRRASTGALVEEVTDWDTRIDTNLEGIYTLEYCIDASWVGGEVEVLSINNFIYTIYLATNLAPLPRWTAKGVIERLLLKAETLAEGEKPRFHLNAEQAEQFDKIEMPEVHFTNCTLREALQTVGSVVHGEPRLRGNEIIFDMYGSAERSGVPIRTYGGKTYSQTIEGAVTAIDSTVDNLVSTIGYAKGVTVDPYAGGYKTVRTETLYARIQDDNMLIQVSNGINRVIKLEASYAGKFTDVDITPYVFEESEYARMSAYTELYPSSRVYALYYTTGGTTIRGLNYKIPKATGEAYGDYAIVRILKAETGNNSLNLEPYPLLAFRVTYESITSARVKQSKQYTKSPLPTEIAYNQGQNLIESGYFGENLKGVVARLGNVDKVITIIKRGLPKIPKAGTLYDDDYYISAVAVEVMPFYTKITLALSKDFNRYSDFVGVNSQRRFFEVSEKQAYDSFIHYRDYVVIGDQQNVTRAADVSAEEIVKIFNPTDGTAVSYVQATSFEKDNTEIAQVVLPVKALPLGNSAVFTFKYQDNYSAGDQAVYQGSGEITGYFQQGTQYKNFYGYIDNLSLGYYDKGLTPSSVDDQNSVALSLPEKYGSGRVKLPIGENLKFTLAHLQVSIGPTEIPTFTYQIDFVSNRKDIVIGSGLARNLPLIAGAQTNNSAKLYVLPSRLNKFAQKVDLTNARLIHDYANGGVTASSRMATFDAQISPVSGQAWVMADSDGNVLIGENKAISGDNTTDILGGLRMTLTHDIFKSACSKIEFVS
nr:MAG TPA: hypothetical protein [Caudoviricetes sp.]